MNNAQLKDLNIPCAYQGGKHRLASKIIDIIFEQNEINEDTKFYDLCCGSGAISIELVKRGIKTSNIIMVDASEWGLFWSSISKRDFDLDEFKNYIEEIPKDITKIKDYITQLSKQSAQFDTVYKFLILQSASFGSKPVYRTDIETWKTHGFRSYWLPTETSNRRSHVNPMMPMPNTLYERVELIMEHMDGISAIYGDTNDILSTDNNSIVYIDPPYQNTTGYGFDLDIMNLINQIRIGNKLHNKKSKIYVSEGLQISEDAVALSKGRDKGGISGDRKKANEEWLNIFQ